MSDELFSNDYNHLVSYEMRPNENLEIKCVKITARLRGWKNALYWNCATLGKIKAYVVYDNETIIHFSYVVRGKEKFTFLNRCDIEIGPCWTHPEYRGLGIYPAVLSAILQKELRGGGTAYMIIHNTNQASQNGVAKVGFKKTGFCTRRNFLKRYHILDEGSL